MAVDRTLQFSMKRNTPVRYDRNLTDTTLKAMQHISEIKARRERAFFKRCMAGKHALELNLARTLVANNEHLLPRRRASEKREQMNSSTKASPEAIIEDGMALE